MSTNHSKVSHGEYFPAIDGLRAIAVVCVILYHVNESWMPAGFVGVDVFFAISGFVVAAASTSIASGNFFSFVTSFYARRIVRIMPALLACLLVTSLIAALLIPSAWLSDSNAKTGLAAFFGVSNFFLASGANDYFSPKTEFNPFTHTWSLGVEEQFYVLFPIIYFWWSKKERRDRVISGAFFVLLVAATCSLLMAAYWGSKSPVRAFYLLPARFWELAGGVALFMSIAKWRPLLGKANRQVVAGSAWILVAGLVCSLVFSDAASFPFPWAILPVLCTLGLIVATVSNGGLISGFLKCGPMRWMGRISYSLYLWHWPVIVLLRWTVGIDQVWQQLFAVFLSLILAVGSFKFIEEPFRGSKRLRQWPRGRVIAVGMLITVFCSGASAAMAFAKKTITLSVTKGQDWNPENVVSDATQNAKCAVDFSGSAFEGGFLNKYSSKNCRANIKIFVVGDSHAVGYSAMLQAYVQQTGATVHLLGKGGCSLFNLRTPHANGGPDCKRFSDAALNYLRDDIRPGDILFLPSLRVQRLRDQWGGVNPVQTEEKRAQLRLQAIEEARSELGKISDRGALLLWEAPKPLFRVPLFRCADWFNSANPVCSGGVAIAKDELNYLREPAMHALADLTAHIPRSFVWDPFPVLCPGVVCSPYAEKRPLYFDGDHLSAYGNYVLVDSFSVAVSRINGLRRL